MQEFERLREKARIEAAREEMALWYADVAERALLDSLQDAEFAPELVSGIELLHAHGVATGIASITWNFAVRHFADRWGIEHVLGTKIVAPGAIAHVWPEDKSRWLTELSGQLGVPLERAAAIGDSSGDEHMLAVAGTAIFVGAQLPAQRPGWLHWPAASVERVARHLVDAWALQPSSLRQPTRTRYARPVG